MKDSIQSRLVTNPLGKRKERDFTSPSPTNRIARSQSQSPSESQNSFTLIDMNDNQLFRDAETNDYSKMVTTTRDAKVATRWLQRTGLLPQFNLGLS